MEIKSSKLPKFKKPTNPLTDEGMKALVIVLGAIVLISGAFYLAESVEKEKPVVLPAKVEVEETVAPTAIPEEMWEATASPTMKVTASPSAQF